MTDIDEPARFYQNTGDGQQLNADTINIVQRVRELVEAHALDLEELTRLRTVYVRTASADQAVDALRSANAVVLTGQPGSGRLVTAVAVITELGAIPHRVDLDPGDDRRELPAKSGDGYIVAIDDQMGRGMPELSELLPRYAHQLAKVGAYLVVTTTPATRNLLGPRMRSVPIISPNPADVLRTHLAPAVADDWSQRPQVLDLLNDASPADAARLAKLGNDAITAHSDDPLHEAISAYRNWSDELSVWFGKHTDGYERALLLSAASLDGAAAGAVFRAADQLIDRVKFERPPGGGLVGDGAGKLIAEIDAVIIDGTIKLPRPAYAASVLEHVWTDRLHLRGDLERWLIDLPTSLRDPAGAKAAYSLIDLAIRHGDAALITHAAGTWAEQSASRELAADALTEAGVSATIGSSIRQAMYRWATRSGTTQSLKLTIADVCGGPLGKSFPRNAMTRLRHLVRNGDTGVYERVTMALQSLADEPHLRTQTLRETIWWIEQPEPLRTTGIRVFLALAVPDADLLSSRDRRELLAEGWRAAFHDPDYVAAARDACVEWLEAAAQGKVSHEVVTTTLADACHSSHDIGILSNATWQWAKADTDPAPIPRETINDELMRKVAARDPLTPGLSLAEIYTAIAEANV